MEESQNSQKRTIENMGLVDLTWAKTAEDLADIESIANVGAILVHDDLAGFITHVKMENVGGVITIPVDVKVQMQNGLIRISGEAFAQGTDDTILLFNGQIIITSVVEEINFREVRINGQLIAPHGSEAAIGSKVTQLNGQVTYYPAAAKPENIRFLTGDYNLDNAYFEALAEPILLIAIGDIKFADDVTAEQLKNKILGLTLTGDITASRDIMPVLQALASDMTGDFHAYPRKARFFADEDSLGREYFELQPEPIPMVIQGNVTLEESVTAELLKSKVSEIVLEGNLTAPQALLPLLRALTSEKHGKFIGV